MFHQNNIKGVFRLSLLTLAATSFAAPVLAAEGDASIDQLDQRIRVLERQLEIQQEEAANKAKDTPQVTADRNGFAIKSADGQYGLELHGLLQADGRFYNQGQNSSTNNQFLLRRVEPTISGNLTRYFGFTITPEFGNSSATTATGATNSTTGTAAGTPSTVSNLLDYYIDLRFDPAANLRIGRFKAPVGLENLQSTAAITFIERGLTVDLQPNRDFGAQLQGKLLTDRLSYQVGIFNGAADGGDAPTGNPDNRFDVAARLFAEPFKNDPGILQGLGVGIAATHGSAGNGLSVTPPSAATTSATYYPSEVIASSAGNYVSTGQLKIFGYTSGVNTAGVRTHLNPQAYWYYNRVGVLTEYVTSTQTLATATTTTRLKHSAFQVATSLLLTDDSASYGGVKPKRPFKIGSEGWGAFEIAARYSGLNIDPRAFSQGFAKASTSSTAGAREYGAAFNWYPNANTKLALNYEDTHFRDVTGAAASASRPNERALLLRAQINY